MMRLFSTHPGRRRDLEEGTDVTSGGSGSPERLPFLDRHPWHVLRLDPIGLGLGIALALVSLTPSLIPRTYLFQGLATGISAAIGYALGVVVSWCVTRIDRDHHASARYQRLAPPWFPRAAWLSLLVGGPLGLLVMLLVGAHWQRELAALMGAPPPSTVAWLRTGPIGIAVFVVLLAAARGVRLLATLAARVLRQIGRAHV